MRRANDKREEREGEGMAAAEELRERFARGEFDYKKSSEICRLLGVGSRSERESLTQILKGMESDGAIVCDERGRYVRPERLGLIAGKLQGNERGFAFLVRDDGEADLFIPHKSLQGALHGDRVFARRVGGERGDEGAVYSVIRRGMPQLTGTYYRDRKCGMVEADERKFSEPVRIVGGLRAYSGEKVLVKIVAYPERKDPEGEIVEILGQSGELSAEEDAILRTQNLADTFSQKVLAEARRVAAEPIAAEGRTDFRGDLVITIDGEDSRDFDDAVHVERDGTCFVLAVHIADVSHYVRRGGALDKEAFARGTSVYFPDRVLPMLPEELSNGICSLNEGEDRYTLSCVMRVDASGTVLDSRIERGIICSKNRMTYTKIAAILANDEQVCAEYAHLVPMCADMRELANILIKKRSARGSIDLDVKEAQITVKDGAIDVCEYKRTMAHRIIEEFMILANETVAEFIAAYELPFVYRVHEKPSEEKAAGFKKYLEELGIRAKFHPDNVRPGEYGKILESLEGSDLFRVVNRVMLRSMSKARYSAENCGHFGLASRCYCHFTSPIRRYPDLLVHRIVKLVLDGQAGEAEESYKNFVQIASNSCSASERRADEAERAVDELYKCWYMRSRLGDSFDGTVSGVTAFGVFVELANTVEGLIRIEDLPPDDYVFVEERYLLKGRKHSYKIGDACRVAVAGCNIGTRRVEFVPAPEEGSDE